MVTELFEPNLGGQEHRFRQFARALAARGRDVTVYTSDHTGGSLPRESTIDRVKVVRYVSLSRYVRNGSRGLYPLFRYWRSTRNLLRRLLAASGPVWVNEMPVAHLLGTSDAPGLVVDWCEYPTDWKVNALAARAARRFRRGTAVSQTISRRVRSLNPRSDLEVVRAMVPPPQGPDLEREAGTIAYVGRIVSHKNLGALADAVHRFHHDGGPQARLIIAGDGPDRLPLERRFRGKDEIQFLGTVSEQEKHRLLQSSWLVAIPGNREGLPTSAVEATVYGTPLLASGAPLNATGEFIRSNGVGVVARGVRPDDFLDALRSVDGASWDRWRGRATHLRSLWDPEENARRLESALDREPA
jgi:glycosyltransferase involved in cell wall biosynthesis